MKKRIPKRAEMGTVKVDWMMARMTLSILEGLEEKGIKFGGLVQDWQELLETSQKDGGQA